MWASVADPDESDHFAESEYYPVMFVHEAADLKFVISRDVGTRIRIFEYRYIV